MASAIRKVKVRKPLTLDDQCLTAIADQCLTAIADQCLTAIADQCLTAIADQNMLVPWYLMTSYMYYNRDISLLSDGLFDDVCKKLYERWAELDHPHKHLIDFDQLSAGTGFALEFEQFPSLIINAAVRAANEIA